MEIRKALGTNLNLLVEYGKSEVKRIMEDDSANMGTKAIELTKVVLIIALVLIPVGLVTLATVNTSSLSASEVAIIASIGIVVIAGVIIMILEGALSKRK